MYLGSSPPKAKPQPIGPFGGNVSSCWRQAGLCRAESGSCDAAGWSWSSSALVPASGALLLVASALALAALFKLRRTQDLPLFKKPGEDYYYCFSTINYYH
jgi:hypothetical protein